MADHNDKRVTFFSLDDLLRSTRPHVLDDAPYTAQDPLMIDLPMAWLRKEIERSIASMRQFLQLTDPVPTAEAIADVEDEIPRRERFLAQLEACEDRVVLFRGYPMTDARMDALENDECQDASEDEPGNC